MKKHFKLSLNDGSLVSIRCAAFLLNIGVYRKHVAVYKRDASGEQQYHDVKNWIWGRATEPYDNDVEFFGLGPIALFEWLP